MKWLSFKRTDDRVVYLREDDIDYIVTYDKKAKIYQKNGNNQIVYGIGIPERLIQDDSVVIRRRSEILKEDLARASMDIQNRDDEIQDLKLENDRLKQQNDIMFDFICSVSCTRKQCHDCKLNRPEMFEKLGAKCAYLQGPEGLDYIRNAACELLEKLEDL